MPVFDTIILGAGFAGLTAARLLSTSGFRVLIIEARNRTGGRAYTYRGFPSPVDLGCSWVHGWAEGVPVRDAVEELGVPAHVPKPTLSLMYSPDGLVPESLARQLSVNLNAANALALSSASSTTSSSISLSSVLFDKNSPLYKNITVEQVPLVEGLAKTLEVGLGARLEETALRWHGYEDNYAGTNAAPEGGFQTVTSRILSAAQSAGASLKLNETVTSITFSSPSSPRVVTTTTPSGATQTYEGHTVICTIPLGVLKRVSPTFFNPPLSQRKSDAIARTHVGVLAKLVLGYKEPWWPREAGSITILPSTSSDAKIDRTDPTALLSSIPLSVMSFASEALPNPHPTLLIYIGAGIAKDIEKMATAQVAAAAHALLVSRILGKDSVGQAPEPTNAVMTSWSNDPYAYGATTTPSLVDGSRSPLDFVELAKPAWDGRLGFAGEHTDVDHRGSVTGAVVSGAREAQRVQRVLKRLAGGAQ